MSCCHARWVGPRVRVYLCGSYFSCVMLYPPAVCILNSILFIKRQITTTVPQIITVFLLWLNSRWVQVSWFCYIYNACLISLCPLSKFVCLSVFVSSWSFFFFRFYFRVRQCKFLFVSSCLMPSLFYIFSAVKLLLSLLLIFQRRKKNSWAHKETFY